jgi:predicted phosphate transport protein (TIGR00153 family)
MFKYFKRLLRTPEKGVLDLLNEHTRLSKLAVLSFAEAIRGVFTKINRKKFDEHLRNVIQLEETADAVRRSLVEEFAKGTLPPISREDFIKLADSVDIIADAAKDSIRLLEIARKNVPLDLKKHYFKMVEHMENCIEALHKAVIFLSKDFRECMKLIARIELEEHAADGEQIFCLKELNKLAKRVSFGKIFLWKELVDRTEEIIDGCEDVGDIIRCVIARRL